MSEYTKILFRVEEKVARITLNVPEKRNAISLELRAELVAALKRAERDDDVSVVLLDGAGPSFCSGYDLTSYSAPPGGVISEALFDKWTDQFARNAIKDWFTIWDLLKPVICKVHGACLAGGTEIMSMCDVVFAADESRIGYPPTRNMSVPDTVFFPWKLSMAQAKYLQLTGNAISGKQAATFGWVAKSFPADRLEAEVVKETRAMATIPADLLAANKMSLNQTYDIMGFRTAITQAVQWHMVSAARVRPNAGIFQKIQAEKGLKEALRLRDEPWKDIDGK